MTLRPTVAMATFSLLVLILCSLTKAQPTRCIGANSAQCQELDAIEPEFQERNDRACPVIRQLDGTCTNFVIERRVWGSARIAHFAYTPGLSSVTPNGGSRNSPRLISNIVSAQSSSIPNSRGLTEMFVFFGQFLDHNFVQTAIDEGVHMNIPIPPTDPVFGNFTNGELPFSRTVRATVDAGGTIERPANLLSSAVDLAAVYSSNEERLESLRVGTSCYLATSPGNYLPRNTGGYVNEPTTSSAFYLAGDVRANENPTLTALQTIFMREHNYWCDNLQSVFSNEETQFQEARKINIAQFQKIVFEEFLPAILGQKLPGYSGFKQDVNVGMSVEFSTAAFRLGHTMIGNEIQLRGPGNSPMPSLPALQMFFRPASVFESFGVDPFIRGAVATTAQEVDTMVMDSLRQILFTNVPPLDGIDLIALNLQRGRDHALPSYNSIRGTFGFPPRMLFSEVTSNMALQTRLQAAYATPDDMDLWVALLAEDHVPGSSLGETMRAIWMAEFTRLRDGDHFYYQRTKHFTGATVEAFPQVRLIRRSKNLLRTIILRNTGISPADLPSKIFKN